MQICVQNALAQLITVLHVHQELYYIIIHAIVIVLNIQYQLIRSVITALLHAQTVLLRLLIALIAKKITIFIIINVFNNVQVLLLLPMNHIVLIVIVHALLAWELRAIAQLA